MAEPSSRTFAESTPNGAHAAVPSLRSALPASAASFDQLVSDQQERVARLAGRLLGWREDVDDVVQDVFLAAFRAWPKFRGQSSVMTWLTRITINACRAHLRRRAIRMRLTGGARARDDAGPPADADRLDREQFALVRSAVRNLPRKYREVVILRHLEEMGVTEIAGLLGLTRNAVDVRLTRARAKLEHALGPLLER